MPLSASETAPFTTLSPHRIASAIEAQGIALASEPFALNSYENRVFSFVDDEQTRWVAKFYRPHRWTDTQILAEHAFMTHVHQKGGVTVGLPWHNVAGETLFHHDGFRLAIFQNIPGRAPERDVDDDLFALGELIGRLHASAAHYALTSRPTLNLTQVAQHSRQSVLANAPLSARQRKAYSEITQALITTFEQKAVFPEPALMAIHGDCHPGNILGNAERGFALVDFDDCMIGPAIQDLWMFLSGDEEQERRRQLSELIEGYEEYHPFDRAQLAWIEPLATARMMRHCAWLLARWQDPAFPAAFSDIQQEGFWDQHIRALEGQRLMLSDPQWLA